MSAGSKTDVGAYHRDASKTTEEELGKLSGQFSLMDHRATPDVVKVQCVGCVLVCVYLLFSVRYVDAGHGSRQLVGNGRRQQRVPQTAIGPGAATCLALEDGRCRTSCSVAMYQADALRSRARRCHLF